MAKVSPHGGYYCSMEVTLHLIGGKWKLLILYYLFESTRRFGELQRLLPNVTQRMLTRQLRELEADGIVHREVFKEVPPRVEYSLTELGWSLQPLVEQMEAWGEVYVERTSESGDNAEPAVQAILRDADAV